MSCFIPDGRSTLKYGEVINNILCVFEWLKENKEPIFEGKIDTNKVALIGHSMGGTSLLSLANRTFGTFKPGTTTLLPHENHSKAKECIVFIDGESTYQRQSKYPILFCLSEERKAHQEQSGTLEDLKGIGYQFHHYTGSRHISFMDHGWALDKLHDESDEKYFNGTKEEQKVFWPNLRHNVLQFLRDNSIT